MPLSSSSSPASTRPADSPRGQVGTNQGPSPERSFGRSSLPGRLPGRAIIGGFLVTFAAVVTFAAYANASDRPVHLVVVAARDIAPGSVIHPDDLRLEDVDAHPAVSSRFFSSPSDLGGAVLLGPVGRDEPIMRAGVALRDSGHSVTAQVHELSMAVDRERALNGELQRGEWVDVVATFGSGVDAFTTVVAVHVQVLDVETPSRQSLGSSGQLTVRLRFESNADVLDAALAVDVAKVAIVRSGSGGDGGLGDGESAHAPSSSPAEARRGPIGRVNPGTVAPSTIVPPRPVSPTSPQPTPAAP